MYVTTNQAATIAGVAPATIRRWVARAHLAPVGKRGRQLMFREEDVLTAEARLAQAGHGKARLRDDTPGEPVVVQW